MVITLTPHHKVAGPGQGDRSVAEYYFKFARDKDADRCPRLAGDPFEACFAGRMHAPLQLYILAMPPAEFRVYKTADKPALLRINSSIADLNVR